MRLYLSSFYYGNQPERLHDIVPVGSRVAIIANAGDYKRDETMAAKWVAEQAAVFKGLGYHASQLDLRQYFARNDLLTDVVRKYEFIWVTGGNAFLLRRAMRQSGFDAVMTSLLERDEIAYGGFSAGACVAGPTLRGIEYCDDPGVLADGYEAEPIWQGLGLVAYSIVPHYRSDHPESEVLEQTVSYLRHHDMPFRTLSDGEAILVNGNNEELLP